MNNLIKILSGNDDKSILMGDIIRVLTLYFGQLWFTELLMELEGFRRSLNKFQGLNEDEVREAINELESIGLIKVERRFKSTLFSESIPDLMIKINNLTEIKNIISNDKRLNKYLKLRDEALKALREFKL